MVIFAYQGDFGFFSTGPYLNVKESGPWSADDTVSDVVSDLTACDDGAIEKLMLLGHGNAGVLWLAQGLGRHRAEKFSSLRSKFIAAGSIELHGCACASDSDVGPIYPRSGTRSQPGGIGYEFLFALARSSGVRVTGAIDVTQMGLSAGYKFEGPTMTVFPDGHYDFMTYV